MSVNYNILYNFATIINIIGKKIEREFNKQVQIYLISS